MASNTIGELDVTLKFNNKELDKSLKQTEKKVNDTGSIIKTALVTKVVQDGFSVATSAAKNFAQSAIETGKNFESSMSEVAAISGATGNDFAMLEQTARDFGSSTQFSASEAADALKYMALAGWDANQSSSALGGVLDLAAASGMDLAAASDMVTDYLSAFGMEANQSAYFADMLSYAQANSNTTAEALGEAYKNCAANLNAAGQDVETTTSLLAMMANQGLKGSEAGTALNAVMRDMTAKMKNGAIAIGDTSVQVMDASGNYRDMTDILRDVETATNGMGDAEKAAALSSSFTADSIKGLNLIMNAGVDNAAAFEDELRKSGGTAGNMASIVNDNLEGKLKSLNSKFEELQIQLFNHLEPALDVIIGLLGWCADHADVLIPILGTLGATIGTVFVVDKINQFTSKAKSVFSTLGNVFGKFGDKAKETADKAKESDSSLATSTKNMGKSGESLATRLSNSIKGIANVITTVFQSLGQILGSAVNVVMEPVKAIFKGIGEAIAGFFKALANPQLLVGVVVFTVAAAAVAAAILLIGSAIGVVTPGLANFLNSVLIPLGQFLVTTILVVISSLTDNIIRLTQEAIIPLFQEVRTFLDWLFGKVEEVVGKVWATVSNVIENIKQAFKGAWDFITGIFSNIVGFFQGIWDRVVGIFREVGTKVGNAIGGAFKGVVNGVLATVENILNGPIRAINGLIDVINNVPGIELGHLNEFNLPRMEYGGIVPGTSYSGDHNLIRANSGEMVITRSQQASLWNMIERGIFAGSTEDEAENNSERPNSFTQNNYISRDFTEQQMEAMMEQAIRRATV